ncbi:MAG: methyltransferase domain-containing protein [Clostridia bacterium]|nr:methyltransferase domain-containing protein [Clostridia bacterium]
MPEFVRCPVCGAALSREGGSLYCGGERRHTYDIAKEGYVNLLPPGRAKNARTGDGADMIRAREKFLAGGGYDRYSREAAEFAAGFLLGDEGYRDLVLLDSGCGEGRHTVNMAETFSRVLGVPVTAMGFDASKYGVQAAAKRYVRSSRGPQSTEAARSCDMLEVTGEVSRDLPVGTSRLFAAANIFSLPVVDGCADIFTSLFAPLPDDEVRRVLRPGGILMICAAGAGHLGEMREVLYDNPIPSGGGAAVPEGFEILGEKMIEYKLELSSNEEIMSLFTMTPFYHNAPPEGRARLEAKDSLTVTVQVKCSVSTAGKPPRANIGTALVEG